MSINKRLLLLCLLFPLVFVPRAAAQNQPQIVTTSLSVALVKKIQPQPQAPFAAELSALRKWQAANPPPPVATPTPQPITYTAPAPVTPQTAPEQATDAYYKSYIYSHESGNDPTRYNSSGCLGLGQACPASKLLIVCPTMDYACEDNWFSNYAISRYGSWYNAYEWWLAHSWW